jgi:hypothetical protein
MLERINAFIEKMKEEPLVKLAKNIKEIGDKAPPKKAEAAPGSLQTEQAIAPVDPSRIPDLQRAETISAPIGLQLATRGKGGKDDEPPLSLEQLKGLQQSGIMELVSELRLQRRLFG